MRSLIALCLLASAVSAPGLIVHGNLADPPPSFLPYVGTVGGASGVYLGEYNGGYWVLTANHVGTHSFVAGGATYSVVANSTVSFADYDLRLFRIEVGEGSGLAGLESLTLASTAFSGGMVYAAGNGGSEQSTLQTWTSGPRAGKKGYEYNASGRELKWGMANGGKAFIAQQNGPAIEGIGVQFSETTGSFAGVVGDSGGGFFQNIGGEWVLVGIMIGRSVDAVDGFALFGHATGATDIGVYSDKIFEQIMIPEPGAVGLFLTVAAGGWIWHGRRAKRRGA